MPRWDEIARRGEWHPVQHPGGLTPPYKRGDILVYRDSGWEGAPRYIVQAIEWDTNDGFWSFATTREDAGHILYDEVEVAQMHENRDGVEGWYEFQEPREFVLVGRIHPIEVPDLKTMEEADRFLTQTRKGIEECRT